VLDMLNERRRLVLQALVEEYIASATPVGSKTLVERYELGCSPATVRNELSILEETGFLTQPHISAGRVPTDTGYRSFVDDLITRRLARDTGSVDSAAFELTAGLTLASELDDLMRVTSTALTRLTNCLAITIAPSVATAYVKRLDLLSMAPRRALFVLITESGQVVNRHVELAEETVPERLAEIERALNAALVGKHANEIVPLRDALSASPEGALIGSLVDEIVDALTEAEGDRLYHVGVPALLAQPEFHDADRARPLIEFLEDGIAVLETLSDALDSRSLTVRIGHENGRAELGNVSIVATNYGSGRADGLVGVIGPTRMDYDRAIDAVNHVAHGLEDILG
jgi:heat-inducible transcriptional repressor